MPQTSPIPGLARFASRGPNPGPLGWWLPSPWPSPPPLEPSWLRTPGPGARPGRAPNRRGRRRRRGWPEDPEPRRWGAAGVALPAARRDSPRYPEGQWRTAITIKRLALCSAKAVKPQWQPPLPPLATSAALSRPRVPSETKQSLARARRRPLPAWGAPSSRRSLFPFRRQELPENTATGTSGRSVRTPHPSSPDVSILWELFGKAGMGGGRGSPWGPRRRGWRGWDGRGAEICPSVCWFAGISQCAPQMAGGSVLAPNLRLGRLSPAFYFP